jgi:nifR3 family TIM-barrel protein
MSVDYDFWNKLKKKAREEGLPFVVLAPMADVTDPAFRKMFAKYGKPDVTWTEFVSADGLAHEFARTKLVRDLAYTEEERPIVAQLFTGTPENMYRAVTLCRELGFNGVDINMGCPDRNIEKQGSGAGHIKDFKNSKQVYLAAKKAAGEMPVSIKTRIGYNKPEIDTWLRFLLELKPVALTVHLRTRKELSLVPAHWEYMPEIVKLRDEVSPDTMLIGNGDILTLEEAKIKAQVTGCDGTMVGRGIFGNPLFFNESIRMDDMSLKERFDILIEHTRLFEELLGDYKNFAIMKKHYKAYVNGFEGAKELRMLLMDAKDSTEVKAILTDFLSS